MIGDEANCLNCEWEIPAFDNEGNCMYEKYGQCCFNYTYNGKYCEDIENFED